MPLKQKIKWREPYVSEGLNRKLSGVILPGVYHGFVVTPSSGLTLAINPDATHHPNSVAIIERDGYSITLIDDDETLYTIPSGSSGEFFLVLEASYQVGGGGSQSYRLLPIDQVEDYYVVLAKLTIPAGCTQVTVEMIDNGEKMLGNEVVDPSQSGNEPKHVTNSQAKKWEDHADDPHSYAAPHDHPYVPSAHTLGANPHGITPELIGAATTGEATIHKKGLMSSGDKSKLGYIESEATKDQTATEIRDLLKDVDGHNSGVDADKLDGKHASEFATKDVATTSANGLMSKKDKDLLNNRLAIPLYSLQQPIVDNAESMMPVSPLASAGNGGMVSIAPDVPFTLGRRTDVDVMLSCVSTAWISPTLMTNEEYFLRAQFVAGVLAYYVQRGNLNDPEPPSLLGSGALTSGGGFFSTPIDICLARIVTGNAGATPTVQTVINRRLPTWSVTVSGSGTVYLPIDPFVKTGRITAAVVTPHPTLVSNFGHGSDGWDGHAYIFGTPGFGMHYLPWQPTAKGIITTNSVAGDASLTTCTAMFEHGAGKSMWQTFQVEHQIGDDAGAQGDEHLLSMALKTMLPGDYTNGLAITFVNCLNAQITWEVVR